ncbi:MAG TPA: DNA polymerase I [Acidimicrobiales bacterium]|nr:DNA polymerase I [Acidimicrobiales bacterium]
MPLLMLIDGHSLAYRAFFALPTDMATASGQVTNAVYGFTSMLVNLLKDHHPDRIAVAFDRPEPTFRHAMISDYKAGRTAAPDILRQQLGLVRQVVEALHMPILEVPGYEADDILATLATRARDDGVDVMVVTGDRDTYQLVEDPHVRVLYNRRGVSDYVLYDEAAIHERTGVTPVSYPQYAALRGDPSDNLPGVPGVGEKTAARLINTYGDLDGIYAHLDELTPKLRSSLAAAEPTVRKNAEATPLIRDVPLEVEPDDLVMGGWDREEIRRLFDFLEFRTLWDRLVEVIGEGERAADAPVPSGAALDVDIARADNAAALVDQLNTWQAQGAAMALAGAWNGREGRSALVGLAVVALPAPGPAGGLSGRPGPTEVVWIDYSMLGEQQVLAALTGFLGEGGAACSAHDAKSLIRGLAVLGVDFSHLDLDTAIAAYLVDPAGDQYLLEDLARRYAGIELVGPEAPPPGQLDLSGSAPDPASDAGRRAAAVASLVEPLGAALSARGMSKLYDEVERPLVRVLAKMELTGILVDVGRLRALAAELFDEARRLEAEIQSLAGVAFMVNSTKQLREVLFERLGLAPQKRTKTGFSTDAQSLEKLRGQHPIISSLLRYREVEKLRSTYGDSLLAEVAPDGRIHATFNQTVARTGRLSSDQPNLHNIPIRSEEGRRFRKVFVPAPGCRLLVADYNQIELRVIAHLAEDPGLVEAFTAGADIHTTTAARIYGVEPADVTLAMRSKAKMVSYGLAYGMESYGLAQRLAIPVDEAAEILRAYFDGFPNVRSYMDRVVAEARDRGYTETLFGRRRLIPELQSGRFQVRAAGERQAMNAGIQGLAADIFKVALVRLDARLDEAGLASRLVLQVHDEVILEVPPPEESDAAAVVTAAMCGAAELRVPLTVNLSWGDTWADAKS